MAKRLQLAEQVIRILKGYKPTDDRNIDIREVAIAIDQRRDKAIKQLIYENINVDSEGWVLGDWLTTYCKAAEYDEKRGLHRLIFDYDVFTMPHNKGVWYIGFADGVEDAFIPLHNGYSSLLRGSKSLRVIEAVNPTYFVEGRNAFIKGIEGCGKCELLVKQVAVSGSLSDDDDYAIPSGFEFDIIADVLRIYGIQVAPDEINNDLDGQ
jgi:hypothetical protein